jgi:hypothetical protein
MGCWSMTGLECWNYKHPSITLSLHYSIIPLFQSLLAVHALPQVYQSHIRMNRLVNNTAGE